MLSKDKKGFKILEVKNLPLKYGILVFEQIEQY